MRPRRNPGSDLRVWFLNISTEISLERARRCQKSRRENRRSRRQEPRRFPLFSFPCSFFSQPAVRIDGLLPPCCPFSHISPPNRAILFNLARLRSSNSARARARGATGFFIFGARSYGFKCKFRACRTPANVEGFVSCSGPAVGFA